MTLARIAGRPPMRAPATQRQLGTMGHIFRAVIPYIAMSLMVLALVFLVPAVAVWLPKVLV